VINRLADEDLGADPDLLAGLQDDDLPPGIVEDRALVGDHAHVPISDDDDDSSDDSSDDDSDDDDDEEDLRNLTLSDCNLTVTQWAHTELYEAIFNPAREAMTKLQASKYNTTAMVIPIMAKLRDIYEGDVFQVACRQRGDVSHKDVRMYRNYPTLIFTREMLPPWAIKCCELMVEQLNARFLQRKMNKWVYIATVLDPRIKLKNCFTAGDAMAVEEVKALCTTELENIARHHAPLMLVTPDPPPANAAPRPRPATSTNNLGYLDLFNDSSDDEDEPIAQQVRAQQQRSDIRSLAVMESDRFFDLRAKQGRTYRQDKSFTVMAFFDKNKEDLFLHRLLDSRTRSAKVDEASCERDFSLSGRVMGPLRERMATGVGEKLVSIPLMAMSTPVAVDQVSRKYIAINNATKAKAAKTKAAADTASAASGSDSSSSSSSTTTMMAAALAATLAAALTQAQLMNTFPTRRRR
jgi:hypothetical protein